MAVLVEHAPGEQGQCRGSYAADGADYFWPVARDVEAPKDGRVLCVLVHGMAGSKEDWDAWLELLRERCPAWTLKPLTSLTQHARPVVGPGLDAVARHVAAEVVAAARAELADDERRSLTLHCVSHSMGGLVMRGALPDIFREVPSLVPGVFLTLSTPHLGVKAARGAPEGLWRNLSFMTGFISDQLPQLAAQDASADGSPYLIALSRPGGPYLEALARFQRRLCVTMEHGDSVIPTASGAIWADRAWSRPGFPQHQVAGWGIAARCSRSDSQARSFSFCESSRASSSFQSQALPRKVDWDCSRDCKCSFPRQALEGLETLPWERVVVRLQETNPKVHVFLIAKRSEQRLAEHLLARDCIARLVDVLVDADAVALGWQRTLGACPRRQCCGKWVVATEESCHCVRFYSFDSEDEALCYFQSWRVSRILFDPDGSERRSAGFNIAALFTIRRTFHQPVMDLDCDGKWVLATEEGLGNVKFYVHANGEDADRAFTHFDRLGVTSRVLFAPGSEPDSRHRELKRAGWNIGSFNTIRHAFHRELGRSVRRSACEFL